MSKAVQPHILKQFVLLRQMGSGAYGHVWQVQDAQTKKLFALKKVFDAFRNSIDAQRTYRELNHNNIIKLHRAIKANNRKDFYLVFEFMESDLHSLVGTKVLEKQHQIYVFYQILCGIKYLHSGELIHRDLKPANVLINSECTVKLCDFGLIRSLLHEQDEQQVMSQQVATKWYRAPQLLLSSKCYGKPVDLWSAGCIFAQLLLGKPLFTGDSTLNQLQKIIQFTGPLSHQDIQAIDSPLIQPMLQQIRFKQSKNSSILNKIDSDFHELIISLLQPNPNYRYTADQALNLPIFQQFRDNKLKVLTKNPVAELDDNIRFDMNVYRQKLYEMIQQKNGAISKFIDVRLKLNEIKQKSQSVLSRKDSQSKSSLFKQSLKKQRNRNLSREIQNFNCSHGYQKIVNSKEKILKSYSNSTIKYKKTPYHSTNKTYILQQKRQNRFKQSYFEKSQITSKFSKNQLKNKQESSIYVSSQQNKDKKNSILLKKSAKPNMFRKLMNTNDLFSRNDRPCSSIDKRRVSYKFIR